MTAHPREAILASFREVVLENVFHRISVVELVHRAAVARSTFYEHFENVDDVLRESLRALLEPLAAAAHDEGNREAVELVLTHIQERRTLALALLNGEAASIARNTLAEMIGGSPVVAYSIAGAQLAIIGAWLEGHLRMNARDLSAILGGGTHAKVTMLAHC